MRKARITLLVVLAALPASPANAAREDPRVLVARAGPVTSGAGVTCVLGPGVATSLREVTYPVTVQAVSTEPTTSVSAACWIDDVVTREEYGRVSVTFVGPAAAWAGAITVPFRSSPEFCTGVRTDSREVAHCDVP